MQNNQTTNNSPPIKVETLGGYAIQYRNEHGQLHTTTPGMAAVSYYTTKNVCYQEDHYENGILHCETGPACTIFSKERDVVDNKLVRTVVSEEYWLRGHKYSQEQWQSLVTAPAVVQEGLEDRLKSIQDPEDFNDFARAQFNLYWNTSTPEQREAFNYWLTKPEYREQLKEEWYQWSGLTREDEVFSRDYGEKLHEFFHEYARDPDRFNAMEGSVYTDAAKSVQHSIQEANDIIENGMCVVTKCETENGQMYSEMFRASFGHGNGKLFVDLTYECDRPHHEISTNISKSEYADDYADVLNSAYDSINKAHGVDLVHLQLSTGGEMLSLSIHGNPVEHVSEEYDLPSKKKAQASFVKQYNEIVGADLKYSSDHSVGDTRINIMSHLENPYSDKARQLEMDAIKRMKSFVADYNADRENCVADEIGCARDISSKRIELDCDYNSYICLETGVLAMKPDEGVTVRMKMSEQMWKDFAGDNYPANHDKETTHKVSGYSR